MNPRKKAAYRMLSLIAAVIFVLPCIVLVFSIFNMHLDNLWQLDSLAEFVCAYKNTLLLAGAGMLIQIVIALPAGYAIARIPSPKAQTFFLLTSYEKFDKEAKAEREKRKNEQQVINGERPVKQVNN